MTSAPLDLVRLIPHRPPMVLVDGVERADADGCAALWTVPADSPWVERGRLLRSAYVEIAAQTAALHAGLADGGSGRPARRGHLALVSGLRIHGDARTGDVLRSVARLVTSFGMMTRVDCRIERAGDGAATLLAEGALTVTLAD